MPPKCLFHCSAHSAMIVAQLHCNAFWTDSMSLSERACTILYPYCTTLHWRTTTLWYILDIMSLPERLASPPSYTWERLHTQCSVFSTLWSLSSFSSLISSLWSPIMMDHTITKILFGSIWLHHFKQSLQKEAKCKLQGSNLSSGRHFTAHNAPIITLRNHNITDHRPSYTISQTRWV